MSDLKHLGMEPQAISFMTLKAFHSSMFPAASFLEEGDLMMHTAQNPINTSPLGPNVLFCSYEDTAQLPESLPGRVWSSLLWGFPIARRSLEGDPGQPC